MVSRLLDGGKSADQLRETVQNGGCNRTSDLTGLQTTEMQHL
jgi:hypothetical protein